LKCACLFARRCACVCARAPATHPHLMSGGLSKNVTQLKFMKRGASFKSTAVDVKSAASTAASESAAAQSDQPQSKESTESASAADFVRPQMDLDDPAQSIVPAAAVTAQNTLTRSHQRRRPIKQEERNLLSPIAIDNDQSYTVGRRTFGVLPSNGPVPVAVIASDDVNSDNRRRRGGGERLGISRGRKRHSDVETGGENKRRSDVKTRERSSLSR
jgi:hypothetical protein